MYYPDEVIEDVRSRSDIVDIISGYVTLKKRGSDYQACCPFHHEKTPSFHVSRDKQMYHCFGCGAGGNVYTFVMEYENFSFPEAVQHLAERAHIELPQSELSGRDRAKEQYKNTLREMNKTAANYFYYLLTTERGAYAREYLAGRGLTQDTINKFAIGYADIYENDLYKYLKAKGFTDDQMKDSGLVDIYEGKGGRDKFWNRVMVPILDINGKVIGFGGRMLGNSDGVPKYINTKETDVFDKSRNLFAMNIARRSKRRGFIICEGYMDVIAMHQAGFDNAVASLGTAFTMGQANIIKRYSDDVYLAYDSDDAGTKATLKVISMLRSMGITTRIIDMKPYKDPDEFIKNLGKEAYEERIDNAITGIEFEVRTISKNYKLKDPQDKSNFANDVAKRLSAIEDPVARHSYIDTIAQEYGFDRDSFKAAVSKFGAMGITADDISAEADTVRAKRVEEKKRDSDANKTQKLILTWMVNEPVLFDKLKNVITTEDFVDEDHRVVAQKLFEQYDAKGKVDPAAIVNVADDLEKQHLIAEILQTELPFEMSVSEKEEAINDIVKKLKQESIEYRLSKCATDPVKLQQLIMEKAGLSKLYISL
ncbi:MAG: DNA primase [Lachnospiraceae bacterium]|nr:DNA primase [Lachnospiraceae bacterium]